MLGRIHDGEHAEEDGSFPLALSVGDEVAGVGLAEPLDDAAAVFSVLIDPGPWPDGLGSADLRLWRIDDAGGLVAYAG